MNASVEMEESERLAELRDYLAERDVACPGCRYNLRALQVGTCPECGRKLVLSDLLNGHVRLTWLWWIGFAPLVLIALSGAWVVPVGATMGLVNILNGNLARGMIDLGLAATLGLGIWLEMRWIGRTERFLSRPAQYQRIAAARGWLLLVGLVALLVLAARF